MGRARQHISASSAVARSRPVDRFAGTFGEGRGLGADQRTEPENVVPPDDFAGGFPGGVTVRLRGLTASGLQKQVAAVKSLRSATNMGLRWAKDNYDLVRDGGPAGKFLTVSVGDATDLETLIGCGWVAELAQPDRTINITAQVPSEHRQALDDFLKAHGGTILNPR